MSAEATLLYPDGCYPKESADVAYAAGEVTQLADGRAAVVAGLKAIAVGDPVEFYTKGLYEVVVGTSLTFTDGEPVFWDASANTAINGADVEDGDFYLGRAKGAKGSGSVVMTVQLNEDGGDQRWVFSSRVREIDHADTEEFILIDAEDNPKGLLLVAFLGEVTEEPAGSSEDQLVITLYDEDDNAIDTLTTTNTSPDAVGDVIIGAVSLFSSATGAVIKKIPAGKAAYAKVSQATAGTPAGKLKVRVLVAPLV